MRRRACTDLRGGRSAMVVPTATVVPGWSAKLEIRFLPVPTWMVWPFTRRFGSTRRAKARRLFAIGGTKHKRESDGRRDVLAAKFCRFESPLFQDIQARIGERRYVTDRDGLSDSPIATNGDP